MDLFDGPDDFLGDDVQASAIPADVQALLDVLRSDDGVAVCSAIARAHKSAIAAIQDDVAKVLLRDHLSTSDPATATAIIDAALDYLAELGDGRCVRTMELVLMQRAGQFTDHQSWRARHIVQKIRRFGRK